MTNRSSKEIREELRYMYRLLYSGEEQTEVLELKDIINDLEMFIKNIKRED